MVYPATGIASNVGNASNLLKDSFGLTGFNPLAMLTGIPGLSSSASSSASGYQFNNYNAPFNVGSGELKSTATQSQSATPVSPQSGGVVTIPTAGFGGLDMGQIAILGICGVVAWAIARSK